MRVIRNIWGKLVKLHSDTIFFETGSNTNGSYLRLAGVQICWGRKGITETVNNSNGTTRYSNSRTITYPKPFSNIPVTWVGIANSAEMPFYADLLGGSTDFAYYKIVSNWSYGITNTAFFELFFAIGSY